MKVVVFCGGDPLQLTAEGQPVPKPMVRLGLQPVLWHVMRSHAACGMDDFVLCLGRGADVIKGYFLGYQEALANDFVLSGSQREVHVGQRLGLDPLAGVDDQDDPDPVADLGAQLRPGDHLVVGVCLHDRARLRLPLDDRCRELPLQRPVRLDLGLEDLVAPPGGLGGELGGHRRIGYCVRVRLPH